MNNFLLLNIAIILFLLLVILENNLKYNHKRLSSIGVKLSPKFLLLFVLGGFFLILLLFIKGPQTFIYYYARITFIFLVLGHSLWLSLNKKKLEKGLLILSGLIIILYRFTSPSLVSHNFFLLYAILWLAPFFFQVKILNLKRFLVISMLWFIYDFSYIWLSDLSYKVHQTTNSIKFPLAIVIGETSIGIADLFWAAMLITLLKYRRQKIIAIATLISSNLLLGWYSYSFANISGFPLLVLWVPLGLIVIKTQSKS
ncbi:hypothetical protein A3C23_02250 [Candidatus Roizmanbacteria bacterium RIFCSPHIGHO2_02_FULL_37_13b]|uniref:Uncharacterized protein n=1 Tax=Candidatus Roizmanbacteria bacterium RIFCSPLOWO2_02_FULL_36_11 TaxID=1802071 RepID=A0A1F7JGK5_9BACT|nr:MAG: hypothetical protein A3C23_02250 [Candidatus Roizmanbacteria bacterium RIFCSPHIGHO2_02_FULL_37_13b]OGK54751.1 MAG: hypothetical protein A3H78_05680 [Candidatus Roizmanbacteria bacterium RIFCSPLOWO2_02_FULL_36_11]